NSTIFVGTTATPISHGTVTHRGLSGAPRRQSMKRHTSRLLSMVCLVAQPVTTATSARPSFRGLGDLPGGDFHSVPHAIASSGSVVVGDSSSAWSGPACCEAFLCLRGCRMAGLGGLPDSAVDSHARAVSANGSVVVGYAASGGSGGKTEAFRW